MYILHYAPDNASLIIRLVLEEMGVRYQTCLVDRSVNAQKFDAYTALNPMGLIPVLETPDGPIFETAAILLYLTDTHAALAPGPEHPARGAYLSWLFATSNGLHADMRQLFYTRLYSGTDPKGHALATRERLRGHLDRLEGLTKRGHAWFGAPTPSALDFYVAIILRWLALYPTAHSDWFTLGDWPGLYDLATCIETRPAMQAAIAAEGLGATPLTSPILATPSEGSAT